MRSKREVMVGERRLSELEPYEQEGVFAAASILIEWLIERAMYPKLVDEEVKKLML